MVERYNRTLEDMLSKFVAQNQRDWDEHPPFIMMAYRSSEHETRGCSPSDLMIGRALRLPIDEASGGNPPFPHRVRALATRANGADA